MLKKNLNLYICLLIVSIFTVVYFIVANKTSYAFEFDEKEALYQNKISLLKVSALKYVENNPNVFDKESTIYLSATDLIEKGYLFSDDEEGNFFDPRSNVKTLNDYKVKITNNNGEKDISLITK